MEGDFEIDYTGHIADNIYKLARLGVHGLAQEMGVEEQVVRNGVDEYFGQEQRTRSKEVHDIVRGLKRSKETQGNAKGNEESTRNQKDIYLLENHLFQALQVISWTQKLSLSEISSKHNVTRELQMYYIRLFIEFRKYLGYGVGDRDEDKDEVSDDKLETIRDPKEQMDAP